MYSRTTLPMKINLNESTAFAPKLMIIQWVYTPFLSDTFFLGCVKIFMVGYGKCMYYKMPLVCTVQCMWLFIFIAYSRVRYRSPNFCPSVSPSVRPSVHSFVRPFVRSSVRQNLRRSWVFSTSVRARSVKPCIVIVLDIPFKHAP